MPLNTGGPIIRNSKLVADDLLFRLGTDSDIVLLNRSTALAADTELTNVIEGTSDHFGVAANSLIISNITDDGDILLLVSKAGNSQGMILLDGSTGDLELGAASGQSVDIFIAGVKEIDYATGALAFQQATTISTTTGALTLTPTTDVIHSDATGIIVGATAQITVAGVTNPPELQVLGTGSPDGSILVGRFDATAGTSSAALFILRSRAAIGSFTIVQNGDELGSIFFLGDDGVDYGSIGAGIKGLVDGTPGVGDMPGLLSFQTTADGAESPTERWRMTSVGVMTSVAGTPANAATADGSVLATGGIAFTDVANAWIDDASQGTGTVTHYIGNNTINVTAPSDERLKEAFLPYEGSVMAAIRQMNFQTFLYKPAGLREQYGRTFGLTAQGVQGVLPEYVFERTDGYLQIDYPRMMPPVLRGLQEVDAKITHLQERLAILEIARNA